MALSQTAQLPEGMMELVEWVEGRGRLELREMKVDSTPDHVVGREGIKSPQRSRFQSGLSFFWIKAVHPPLIHWVAPEGWRIAVFIKFALCRFVIIATPLPSSYPSDLLSLLNFIDHVFNRPATSLRDIEGAETTEDSPPPPQHERAMVIKISSTEKNCRDIN
ncbi:hypothetical protein J6590_009799 [Homalodisca vitripennis]|nr:hypothetical protein J6590_009799 [Homalodisca vitripennis]